MCGIAGAIHFDGKPIDERVLRRACDAMRHRGPDTSGIWTDAGWVGGYELGIAFPPDWVGNYVYEMTDTETDRIFEPGTIVNFESQFFAPRMSGITYYVDTLLFKADRAYRPLKFKPELVVVGV